MSPKLTIHPPLLNTACPWATTQDHLSSLLKSPSTGAITTRTSLIEGFAHNDAAHQYTFFDPSTNTTQGTTSKSASPIGSINSFGYSPITLDQYLSILEQLGATLPQAHSKTVIISVTGSPASIAACYDKITSATRIKFPLAMEINLSCPNIPNSPPPAYDSSSLTNYLSALPEAPTIPIGIKTPPYTYSAQFTSLIAALEPYSSRISFVTATNTLGSCVVLDEDLQEALPGGMGGMAGVGIHPLSVGNVRTLRRMLDERGLQDISVIGVGGVQDGEGYRRMRRAGAEAVGLATGLGAQGVGVFERIERHVKSDW